MEFQNSHFTNLSAPRDPQTALYKALWHARAGPLVTVPREGELVIYFPQGHLAQVEASINQIVDLPSYNLPSKILCRVIKFQLKTEPDTDEVSAQVALLPELIQDENAAEMESPLPRSAPEFLVNWFCKTLTASDTSIYGGFSVLKCHADESFPHLELVAKDLHWNEWRFEHTFSGQPRRHLLTRGWRDFVSSKRPVVGDAFAFLRGENGQLGVGLRRAMRPQGNVPSSTSSSLVMFPKVLANAWEAYTKRTIFIIFYKPRRCLAEFIVPFDQYMESMRNNYSIGTRFQRRFESEESLEHRFNGSIVGIEDADPIRWMDSKWKCLQVIWDQNETSTTRLLDRVSPWQIEPALAPPAALNHLPMP